MIEYFDEPVRTEHDIRKHDSPSVQLATCDRKERVRLARTYERTWLGARENLPCFNRAASIVSSLILFSWRDVLFDSE